MPKRRYVFNAVINHCRSILQASPFTAFVNIYNYKKVCSTPWNSLFFLIILNFLRDPSSKIALFKSFWYGWWFRFRFVCWLCLLILFQFVLFLYYQNFSSKSPVRGRKFISEAYVIGRLFDYKYVCSFWFILFIYWLSKKLIQKVIWKF